MYDDLMDGSIEHLKNGWTKGKTRDSQGNVCALGALENAMLDKFGMHSSTMIELWDPVVNELDRVAKDQYRFTSVVNLNDAESTKIDDVITVFEKVRAKEQI